MTLLKIISGLLAVVAITAGGMWLSGWVAVVWSERRAKL